MFHFIESKLCLFLVVGDQTIAETIANVITSLPFIVLGLQAPRQVSPRNKSVGLPCLHQYLELVD